MTQVSASLYLCSFMESVFGIRIVLLPNTTQQTINVNAEHISVERVLGHITAKSLIYIYWMVFGIRMILLPNNHNWVCNVWLCLASEWFCCQTKHNKYGTCFEGIFDQLEDEI